MQPMPWPTCQSMVCNLTPHLESYCTSDSHIFSPLAIPYCTADNQRLMADEGAIECLIELLTSPSELIQRQSAKALANLGVNADNKPRIATAGGIPKLVALAGTSLIAVKIEAVAALANLAVNGEFLLLCSSMTSARQVCLHRYLPADANELEIVKCHGLEPIVNGTMMSAEGLELGDGRSDKEIGLLEELGTQCARALRNLSVNREYLTYNVVRPGCILLILSTFCDLHTSTAANKAEITSLGAIRHLLTLMNYPNERIAQQVGRGVFLYFCPIIAIF